LVKPNNEMKNGDNPIMRELVLSSYALQYLQKKMGGLDLTSGTWCVNCLKGDNSSAIRRVGKGAYTLDGVPVENAECLSAFVSFLEEWNRHAARACELAHIQLASNRDPAVHHCALLAEGDKAPTLVVRLHVYDTFCHCCGKGELSHHGSNQKVTLSKCPNCSLVYFCNKSCRQNSTHACQRIGKEHATPNSSLSLRDKGNAGVVLCCAPSCKRSAVSACSKECPFPLCASPECAEGHRRFCMMACTKKVPQEVIVFRYLQMLRKMNGKKKKKKKKKNVEFSSAGVSCTEVRDECYLCLEGGQLIDSPCGSSHKDRVHASCWERYVDQWKSSGSHEKCRCLACPLGCKTLRCPNGC
jgi:hypothetical protein